MKPRNWQKAPTTFSRVARLLLLVLCGFTANGAVAGSCLITETMPKFIGKNKANQSYTFSNLTEITQIVSFQLKNSSKHQCNANDYSFSNNIVTVYNSKNKNPKCKAKFTVMGLEKNCTPDVPVTNDISQIPLFLTQSAAPNVMYVLDDSGSMQFELMPGEIISSSTRYIFPRADGIYGDDDYTNRVPTPDDNDPYNARSRSPQVNTLYYNPSVTYFPWIKADGSSYPDALTSCALHNPERTTNSFDAAYCRNLTANNSNYNDVTWYSCDSDGDCSSTSSNKTFWPAKYFWYKGSGSKWAWGNYTKVEIRSGNTYSGHDRDQRDDCADAENGNCTYTEEIQNFANWYTYYRSRVLTARAGSGFAFAEQGASLRVGYGTINQDSHSVDGVNNDIIVNGVRPFIGDARTDFFEELYTGDIPAQGTPLRAALNGAGEYFSRTDNKGPWGATPGTNDTEDHLECRRNYTVLMTDGYWSGSDVSGGPGNNNDGSNNPSHSRPIGSSYTYNAVSPFTDSRDDTLADVAMYYWKNDLRTDLDNLVPQSKTSPAFWQHMVTYGVGLGVVGTIDPDSAFAAIQTGATITWPNPSDDDVYKIDDLLHAGVNSRGGFFSAADPDVFANELSSVLQAIADESKSSASSIAANSTRLDSGTLVYQASFNSVEWSGRIVAYSLLSDGGINAPVWDTNSGGIPAHASRNIFAGVGVQGVLTSSAIEFTTANWNSLSLTQQLALQGGGTVAAGKNTLQWLRGDQSRENIDLRARSTILGDIVNSDPFFVGSVENFGFSRLPGTEGSSYAAFLTAKSTRTPMIYVGANDGMLHGFNAETGVEQFAYIPLASFPALSDLSDPDYGHRYFVDGSPRASDVYLGGAWKTVLVGAMGAGGRSVYAMDVTTPNSFDQTDLLWEFSTAITDTHKLGVAMSEPAIARMKVGNKWVAIFGNGYASGDTVKLFVVDLSDGSLIKAIDTGESGVDNGLASPVPVDVDNDRITDYVYAGDLKGNMWKFDFTGASVANWDVAFKSGSDRLPLFQAVDADDNPQPITSRPTVGRHSDGGYIVYFGTGKYYEITDAGVPVAPQIQDFYGIRDSGVRVTDKADLVEQDIFYEGFATTKDPVTTPFPIRLVTSNSADSAPQYGWHINLLPPNDVATGERQVSKPILRNGRIIFATIIPNDNICGFGGSSWLMEVDAQNGGRISDPVLDANGDGKIDELDMVLYNGDYYPISGQGTDEMIKTPGIVGAGELEYKYTSGTSGTIGVITERAGDKDQVGRQSWRQLQ
ncbi:MAG: pilus assembly protein [Spongiibacteraceae bacterium]